METVANHTRLSRLLAWCEQHEASDLHLRAGSSPSVRIDGELRRFPESVQAPPEPLELQAWLTEAFFETTVARILERRELDLSFFHGDRRYRANFSKQRGLQACSFRAVPQQRKKLQDLRLPDSLTDLLATPRGLVLVTGPTGQGKSTTARALLQELNSTRALRVITIEDPIEYVFTDDRCEFEQREVGLDTASFADGIRNAMRQDPDVLFIGEIRDRESIFAALQAVETGHLVFSTLHADSVPQALARLREHFPATEQGNVSSLLARNLTAVINQRLLPAVRGGRVPCIEVLRRDAGVEDAVRKNDLHLLSGIIEVSTERGMHTFDQYLIELLAAGDITNETATHHAVNRHKLELARRGFGTQPAILRPDKDR
ncbi:MAG: PilT/PilU family type 4a pilus ATPase [Verrucomicrobiae bacterium]|nr:PilT/PilU family type 4a pilus ATPase [Verrucomicrobiae bacterium]